MRRRAAILSGAAVVVALGLFFLTRDGSAPGSGSQGVPSGPAPALPPGFPPMFPGATLDANRSAAVEGGWQRSFLYTAKAKAPEIISFYRRALISAGLLIMAEGGGTYGGMLRAQDKGKKRMVYVDVDAPEEAPSQTPKITVTIVDVR
jgi:hypothetical protein